MTFDPSLQTISRDCFTSGFISMLVAADRNSPANRCRPSLMPSPHPPMQQQQPPSESLSEMVARVLFSVVQWTKDVASQQRLTLTDQVLLLRQSWSELFLLSTAQWCLSLPFAGTFGSAPNIPGSDSRASNSMDHTNRSCGNILHQMDNYRLFQIQVENTSSIGIGRS